MPHQCLQCGFTFEEGSSALLQGCPDCKGTRFFYSPDPIDKQERERLQQEAGDDIRKVIADVLSHSAPEAAAELQAKADADGWASLKPSDVRRIVKKVQAEKHKAGARAVRPEDLDQKQMAELERRKQEILASLHIDEEELKPDTVTIHDGGAYEIDVKGLLEKEPIVVHKDGAYLIHLPSLFGKKA